MAVRPVLQTRQCTMDDLRGMIRPATDDWSARIDSNEQRLKSIKDGAVRAFYERQNETMTSFVEVDAVLDSSLPRRVLQTFMRHEPHSLPSGYGSLDIQANGHASMGNGGEGEEERLLGSKGDDDASAAERDRRWERWALNLNILVNLLLLGVKGAAALASNSISILASFVDSALDVLSTAIIWGTSRAASASKRKNSRSYPTGKKRFEPLGILIFSVLQIATFAQVFLESITRLIDKDDGKEIVNLSWFGKGVILGTIAVKLGVYLITRRMKNSGVAALAQDALNDVYFNTASLLFPWLGSQLKIWQLDALGGALLSLYVIFQWGHTLLENFANLSGRVASEGEFSRVLYLVSRFEKVEHISSLEIYHAGEEVVVEVDVCLPPDTSLHLAHDIGEVMQTSIEALNNVARCFCHLDYSPQNPQAHLSREEQRALASKPLHHDGSLAETQGHSPAALRSP